MVNRFAVTLSGLPESRQSCLVSDFRRSLIREGISVAMAEDASTGGARGDVLSLGEFTIELISSGTVVAFLQCLKAYIAREQKLALDVCRADGAMIKITLQNIDSTIVRSILNGVGKFE